VKPGAPVAILRIPRIGLDMVVVEGIDDRSLQAGPGHYPGTALPWSSRGRVAIAGHRTTFLHPFWDLQLLLPGDRIVLDSRWGRFVYQVTTTRVVLPTDTSVLAPTRRPTLVLTTCEPRFSASHRLVVFAQRIEADQ
jgi:sortase A